jgi:hypothetical protein
MKPPEVSETLSIPDLGPLLQLEIVRQWRLDILDCTRALEQKVQSIHGVAVSEGLDKTSGGPENPPL